MARSYKSLSNSESGEGEREASAGEGGGATTTREATGGTGGGEVRLSLTEKDAIHGYECYRCEKVFRTKAEGMRSLCQKVPTNCCSYPDPNRCCFLKGYRGCWYHMTHDELPHDENQDTDMNILKGDAPDEMTAKLWLKFILISLCCLPCICMWLPCYVCSVVCGYLRIPRHQLHKREPQEEAYLHNNTAEISKTVAVVVVDGSLPGNDSTLPGNDSSLPGNEEELRPPTPPSQPPPESSEEEEEGEDNDRDRLLAT